MKKTLDIYRRIVFLGGFVVSLTIHMNVYPKVVSLSTDLGIRPPVLLSMISYAAMTAMLVLGIIPLKKFGTKSKNQLVIGLSLLFMVLMTLAVSAIIVPIYQMTASLE